MVIVPLAILRRQVHQTSRRLDTLIHQVEEVESAVAADSQTVEFDPLVKKLHICNTELIKLERRWHFQDQLAIFIQDFIKNLSLEAGSMQRDESCPKRCGVSRQVFFDHLDKSAKDNGGCCGLSEQY